MGWVNIWLEVDDVAGEKGWSEKRVNPSLVTSAFNEMVHHPSCALPTWCALTAWFVFVEL